MRCAIVGDPAGHSLSPAIHRAGYQAAGLDWTYEAITVPAASFGDFVAACRHSTDWAGLSVTAPHKQALLELGEPDAVARLVGGGNTIVFASEPKVYNTDVPGFVRAWRRRGLTQLFSAVIIGNGATARSLLVALAGLSVKSVTVLARDPQRAGVLRTLGNALNVALEIQPLGASIRETDLLANTVPAAATSDHAAEWAARSAVLFDAIYDPWPTPLGEAAAPEQPVITGLELLAGQAVDQFHLLTGAQLSYELALSAARAELVARRAT
ncbi:MAG: shikimate dehydrogenase [Propionibacteriaceae bacterium]|nr:shikimate dehydrogenase [Propionibacteriaceae bacterium]